MNDNAILASICAQRN